MYSGYFLFAGVALVMVLGAKSETKHFKEALTKKLPPTQFLPRIVSMALIAAQVSELLKMIEHISIVNVVATLMLFSIVMATRSGTEGQLH